MTAMDFWLLLCMLFVQLAMFEYAIQLLIKFGRGKKIQPAYEEGDGTTKEDQICHKIDRYALILFPIMYGLATTAYFTVYLFSHNESKEINMKNVQMN